MNLKSNTILPLIINEKKFYYIAEQALNNIIEPFPNQTKINFVPDFDWTYTPDSSSDTYQLYLQSLRVVSYLLDYYRNNKNSEILDKALEITLSWMDYEENEEATGMTWYDHTTGNRTQTIIELIYQCHLANIPYDEDRFRNLIIKHAKVLSNDDFHNNNNHALMMDRSLMMLGIILNNEYYFLKGLDRARTVFWVSYSFKGIHLENSPGYHFMVTRMFLEIESYLNKNDQSLGEEILRMFPLLEEYKEYINKPNNIIPPLGDSARIKTNYKNYNWKSISDPDAGISIIKNKENELYLAFIAGYSSPTHKHSDDLSFILNYKKMDFFEDAGLFGYGRNNKRRYVRSYEAHSIFSVGKTYEKSRTNKISKEIYTDQFLNSPLYSVVSGYNKAHKETKLRRTLYYIPSAKIIVGHDIGSSSRKQNWIRNFNLSEEVTVSLKNNKYELKNDAVKINLVLPDCDTNRIIHGDLEILQAINSDKPGSFIETNQVRSEDSNQFEYEKIFIIELEESKYSVKQSTESIIINTSENEILLPKFDF